MSCTFTKYNSPEKLLHEEWISGYAQRIFEANKCKFVE